MKLPLLGGLVVAAFAWGVVSANEGIFPYPQLRSGWSSLRGTLSSGDPSDPAGPGGFWAVARTGPDLPESIADLANLPYLAGVASAPDASGITSYDPAAAHNGLNLVVSAHQAQASLVDMNGNVLHTWRKELEEVWPGVHPMPEPPPWRRAHLLPNGHLLAIFEGVGMLELDKDSNLVWASDRGYHHDLFVDESGTIYTLARQWRDEHPRLTLEGRYREDFVATLTPDGEETARVSVLDCFIDSDYRSLLSLTEQKGDLLHVNTIELLDGRFADRYPMWQAGRVLISVPTIATVAVLDLEQKTVTWAMSGLWFFQHQPTVLPNGRLMVFDNGAAGASRVVEVDPLTGRVEWSYEGSEAVPFFSKRLGSCQRLPNGNTLITESQAGRAFEVTPDKKIAWEYLNPHRAGARGELIAVLPEVVRLDPAPFAAAFPEVAAAMRAAETEIDVGGVRELIDRTKK